MEIKEFYLTNIPIPVIYLIGKNKEDNNDIIIASSPNDVWFHSADYSSAHIIVKIPNIKLTKKQMYTLIKNGAILCKNSTNKLINEKNVEIIYTKVKNVYLTNKIGQVYTENEKSIIV